MNEAGYTLTETLAALVVIGLAFGGLTLGVQVLGPLQLSTGKAVSQLQSVRAAQQLLEQLLARGAPFESPSTERFSGDPQQFRFACGEPTPCSAVIHTDDRGGQLTITAPGALAAPAILALAGPARFVYGGSRTNGAVWPPAGPERQPLKSIGLVQTTARGETSVLGARVWAEQPAQCAFDPILQDCR